MTKETPVFSSLIQETECPKGNDILITIFNVILYDEGILYTLYLFLFFILATHFEGIFSYLKVGHR